jgi:hypothetical protein
MSHWTTVKTQIRDIAALHRAANELGLTMKENAQARGYYQSMTAEYVLETKQPCPYDIAVNRLHDGTFQLVTDWHAGGVAAQVGQDFKKLIQLYGVHKATMEARKKGLNVSRTTLANGSIKLAIQGRI